MNGYAGEKVGALVGGAYSAPAVQAGQPSSVMRLLDAQDEVTEQLHHAVEGLLARTARVRQPMPPAPGTADNRTTPSEARCEMAARIEVNVQRTLAAVERIRQITMELDV